LLPHRNVTVFYGHIHQENHFMTGIASPAKSLMFRRRRRDQPKRLPVLWDAQPYRDSASAASRRR
jgi:hypothetical protein